MTAMTFQIENINENIKIIKKKKIEDPYLKSIITEIKNSPDKLNSKFKISEEESVNLKTDQ